MTREEAYYRQILLMSGFADFYDAWLDSLLIEEDPLSDVVLRLSECGGDQNQIVSALHSYCQSGSVDEWAVHESLRLFLKQAYGAGEMTRAEVASAMYRFSVNHHAVTGHDWEDMNRLSDYYSLAPHRADGLSCFDAVFLPFLNDDISLEDKFWNQWINDSQ
ncbi:MAG: hypothetical protein J6D21_10745 [Clostridia bacterium]|nr:hypothetical protein [Clostridia bacterium]